MTKGEYDRSHSVLTEVLQMDITVAAVGRECVEAMKILQENLRSKERLLANYKRLPIFMHWSGKTTSPTESMNNNLKHGEKSVNSTMNSSNAISLMSQSTDERLLRHRKESFHQLGRTNLASRAPTEKQIQIKIQNMIDQNFGKRLGMKAARVSDETWITWDFAKDDSSDLRCAPWPHLARFHRAHQLKVRRKNENIFLWCDCHHHDG